MFTDAGPAATNLLGGWVNSWGDSTPILFFAGHNNRYSSPRRQTKEIPLADVFGPVSKWVGMINDPSQVAEVIRRAYVKLRSGRSGPVVIGVPYDVTSMPIGNFVYAKDFYLMPSALAQVGNIFYIFMRGYYGW